MSRASAYFLVRTGLVLTLVLFIAQSATVFAQIGLGAGFGADLAL